MKTNILTTELLHNRLLTLADVKKMLLGHWGTMPGQNFIYVQKRDGQYPSQV